MLVVVSDLHLGDGTCAKTVSADAFRIFRDRLQLLAQTASVRDDGSYRPIEEVELLLLGDIFEVIHSTLWLSQREGDPGYARPWSDPNGAQLPAKLGEITRAILDNNAEALAILRLLASGEAITLPQADSRGNQVLNAEPLPVKVKISFIVGNHDWFYHLPGEAYDRIRQQIIEAMGLVNGSEPFPHDPRDSEYVMRLFDQYRIFARHVDYYDKFNYNREKGRNFAALGDALAVELLNRFPLEVEQRMGDSLPKAFYKELHEITNTRPSVAAPLWISGQLRQFGGDPAEQAQVKAIWDELADEFLNLEFVRSFDREWNPFDSVDGLEMVLKFARRVSFESINKAILRMQKKMWSDDLSFSKHAMREPFFTSRRADYIVYGHTHYHETVPLDRYQVAGEDVFQFLVNSGTWRSYHDLTRYHPEQQKFIPFQLMTYLAFYKDDERRGRRYEAWTGRLV